MLGTDKQLLTEKNLHTYQQFCVDFVEAKPQCALFLDCGLGKTVIALTAISHLLYDSFEVSCILIIAPLRVARDTWIAELDKWEHLHGYCAFSNGSKMQSHKDKYSTIRRERREAERAAASGEMDVKVTMPTTEAEPEKEVDSND